MRADHDTLTIGVSLAVPRSRYNAHEVRTSQAECRGFESRLPLHLPPLAHRALVERRLRPEALRDAVGPQVEGVKVDRVDPVGREGPRDLCSMFGRVVDRLAEEIRERVPGLRDPLIGGFEFT